MDADEKARALVEAVSTGNAADVKALLAQGADPEGIPPGPYCSLLEVSAERGDVEMMELLLGAGVHASHDALAAAAGGGHWDAVQLLLARGASINQTEMGEPSALGMTVLGENPLLRLLLEHGANPNHREPNGFTSLFLLGLPPGAGAAMLLENGADPNARDDQGMSSLMWMVSRGPEWLVELLLNFGAEPNLFNEQGNPELGIASTALTEAVRYGSTNALLALLVNGADPNLADAFGDTPLMLAVEYAPHLVPDLLQWGADPGIRDHAGLTAADRATRQHQRLQEILAEAGSTPEI